MSALGRERTFFALASEINAWKTDGCNGLTNGGLVRGYRAEVTLEFVPWYITFIFELDGVFSILVMLVRSIRAQNTSEFENVLWHQVQDNRLAMTRVANVCLSYVRLTSSCSAYVETRRS